MNAALTPPSERTPLRETALPGWRRWVFPAAVVWALGYGAFLSSSALASDAAPSCQLQDAAGCVQEG